MAQDGKIQAPNAPPFATPDGKPAGQGQTSSGEQAPHLRSRPQQAGTVEERVNPTSIPRGGPIPKMDPGAASKAAGAQGLDRPKPFKIKGA